ncbi:MAG: outer membrane protein assembly factor BamA [Puniceicoccaceae bacterium]
MIFQAHRGVFAPLLFLNCVLCSSGLWGQTPGQATPVIEAVEIRYDGYRNVSEPYIRGNIQVSEGQFYDQAVVDQSIRSLYRTGLFDLISVSLEELGEDQLKVIFNVRPKYRIASISFEGNDSYRSARLRSEISTVEGNFIDEFNIKADADAISRFYATKGFSNARVDYDLTLNEATGRGEVVFRISEGENIRVSDIRFQGNDSIKSSKLRKALQIKKWSVWLSWITGKGKFTDQDLFEDIQSLLTLYRNEGFLDVEIPESGIEITYPRPNRVALTINIREGRRYQTGTVGVSGNQLFSSEELVSELKLLPGSTFSPAKVEADRGAIRNFYGSRGYLETLVRADRTPNLTTGAIDVKYEIRESEKYFLEAINIQGNTKSKSIVILRELALQPGDVFDLVRMENSRIRLENTGYFESVIVTPESTQIPNRKDLRVIVQEGRTGNLTFGAGFSSLERAVFFAEISQSNFDLFNWRSYFQGDGQKFRLRFQLGSRSSEIVLSFEEPWLFEKRLAFGFEIFRTASEFNSRLYDETRTGFEVYLRRRLIELIEGRLSYRLEQVEIENVSRFASSAIRDEEGSKLVSKVGITLVRDTRDRFILTRRGNRISADSFVAGGYLGGDVDYWRGQLRYSHFFPTFDALDQTFSVFLRGGALVPYGDSETVPFFDRWFLGGPSTLRGFSFRDVGPKDDLGEPIGGNSYAYFSAEYRFLLAQPLAIVFFYDWGFVNADDWDFSPDNYNDNYGVGLRIFVLGAPMRLDFGFPITTDDQTDDDMQFNFSFGTRF